MMISLLLSSLAFASSDPSACEPTARAKIQNDVDAYYHLSQEYPQDFGQYACYAGQKVKFVAAKQEGESMYRGPYFTYFYSVPCGDKTVQYGAEYYLRDCSIVGE